MPTRTPARCVWSPENQANHHVPMFNWPDQSYRSIYRLIRSEIRFRQEVT